MRLLQYVKIISLVVVISCNAADNVAGPSSDSLIPFHLTDEQIIDQLRVERDRLKGGVKSIYYSNPLFDLIVDKGASVNMQDTNRNTLVYWLAEWNLSEPMRLLLAHSAILPNVRNNYAIRALHCAAASNCSDTMRLLLAHYAIDPNVQDNDEWTVLHWALPSNNSEVVKLLLQNGADLTIINEIGSPPYNDFDVSSLQFVCESLKEGYQQAQKKEKILITTLVSQCRSGEVPAEAVVGFCRAAYRAPGIMKTIKKNFEFLQANHQEVYAESRIDTSLINGNVVPSLQLLTARFIGKNMVEKH